MIDRSLAVSVVESLRRGQPPQRGADLYSVGEEDLLRGIETYHLASIGDRGTIRFVSGTWGAGKTHFFRLIRELAFRNGFLVSNVELNVDEAPLNKFEKVFYAVVRNIQTPSHYLEGSGREAAPFGSVVLESLKRLGNLNTDEQISHETFARAVPKLMEDRVIDIDFKKMIEKYWETFLPDRIHPSLQEKERQEVLQWFSGEGGLETFRRKFDVNKAVSRETARLMLQSLSEFVRLAGYRGLMILFDEAEQTYSSLRKSDLKVAHNNLLSLMNNIELLSGLFLVYATTPDFFTDPKHGIVVHTALAGRIGRPSDRPPRALETIWNIDELQVDVVAYRSAARKIRTIYQAAFPESASQLPSEEAIDTFVSGLSELHPQFSVVRFWRVMVTALISHFDDHQGDEPRPVEQLYDDVMVFLREAEN